VIDPPPRTNPGWRRVAAFAVDHGVILAYLGLLALLGVVGRAVGVPPTEITTPAARVVAQLAGIAVLTLPVTLWFAGWEASPGGATPGKRMLGLRVVTTGRERLGWPRSLLRTALKFTIPWGSPIPRCGTCSPGPVTAARWWTWYCSGWRTPSSSSTWCHCSSAHAARPTTASRAPLSRPPDDAVGVAAHPGTAAAGGPSCAVGILEEGVGNRRPVP
jgi:uncharacterized RDD family membrane protein YckC